MAQMYLSIDDVVAGRKQYINLLQYSISSQELTPGGDWLVTLEKINASSDSSRFITLTLDPVEWADMQVFVESALTEFDIKVGTYSGLKGTETGGGGVSAGKGTEFYYDGTVIIPAGAPIQNSNVVTTLAKTPWAHAEEVDPTSVTNTTVLSDIYLYNTGMGRTSISSGAWTFLSYAGVDRAAGVTEILFNVTRVRPSANKVITSGGPGASRTATVVTGEFTLANLEAVTGAGLGGTIDSDAYLQTPSGVYRITARADNNNVTILVPATYVNEPAPGVLFSIHKRLFQVTTGEISNLTGVAPYTLQLYTTTSVQPAYTVLDTDKLAIYRFAKATDPAAVVIYYSYGGTDRYSRVDSPLTTLHGDLAELQGGVGVVPNEEYYHLTAAQHAAMVAGYIPLIAAPAVNHFPYQTAGGALIDSAYAAGDFALVGHNHDLSYISIIAAPAKNHFPYQTAGGELVDSTYDAGSFEPAFGIGTWAGTVNVTTLGTIGTGSWHASTIDEDHGGTGQAAYVIGDLLCADGVASLARVPDVAVGQVWASGGAGVMPGYTDSPLVSNITVSNSYSVSLIADAVVQFGQIVMVDAGTNGRFDINTANGPLGIGVLRGVGPSAQGTAYDIATGGLAYVAMAEDVAVTRGHVLYQSATAGFANDNIALQDAGLNVGVALYSEALYPFTAPGGVAADTITLNAAPGWAINDPVIYWQSGDLTAPTGLVTGKVYWIRSINAAIITLSATRGGVVLPITNNTGSGVTMYFQRLPQAIINAFCVEAHTITYVYDTYLVLNSDKHVLCERATPFTVTLPVGIVGKTFMISNVGLGTVTIDGDGVETINNLETQSIGQWESMTIQCYAAGKFIIVG